MEATRLCKICGETKALSDFNLDHSPTRRLHQCRACLATRRKAQYLANRASHSAKAKRYRKENAEALAIRRRAYWEKNREAILANNRERYHKKWKDRLTYAAKLRKTEEGRKKAFVRMMTQRERYPERFIARKAVREAIRTGRLIRQPCEVCGKLKVEAHHDDYAKPLDVRWFCRKHHLMHHGATHFLEDLSDSAA